MDVQWRGPHTGPLELSYARVGGGPPRTAPVNSSGLEHRAALRGLEPGQVYWYNCSGAGFARKLRTPRWSLGESAFLVSQLDSAQGNLSNVDVLIVFGDESPAMDVDIAQVMPRAQAEDMRAYDVGPTRMVVVSGDLKTAQHTLERSVLATRRSLHWYREDSEAPDGSASEAPKWLLIVLTEPVYCTLERACKAPEGLVPLLEEADVIVSAGHGYERTWPMLGGEYCARGPELALDPCGTVYVVSGDTLPGEMAPPAEFVAQRSHAGGFGVASTNQTHLHWRQWSPQGDKVDDFALPVREPREDFLSMLQWILVALVVVLCNASFVRYIYSEGLQRRPEQTDLLSASKRTKSKDKDNDSNDSI